MSQQPIKRKRIVPTLVENQEASVSILQPTNSAETSAPQPAPVEYQQAPSTLPGRRLRADISSNYIVQYNELLKQNGVDVKQLKARKAAAVAAAANPVKAPANLPKMPGLARAGASPGAGGRAIFGSVVDRLERIYASAGIEEDEEEGDEDEGESDEEMADESGSDSPDSSGSSGNDSDDSEDGAPGNSSGEGAGPGPESAGGGGRGAGGPGAAAGGDAAAGTTGPTADGISKKPKQRRRALEAYEADFIDDDEEMRYEKSRQAKAKYDGFFINQGAVELERDPEAEEEQRQGQKRGPRQRPQPGAQPSKAKSQQPVQANRTGGAAISAAATTAGTGIAAAAVNGGAQTPGRVSGKRRVEGDQQQPASKKRKQPQPDAGPAGQKSPRRGVSVAPSGATLPGAPQGLAAFAASLGRSAGATAATSGAAAAAVAAAPAWPVASAERATGQQPAEATSEPAGAVSGSLLPRAVSRRHGANTASLDSVINECIKKLTAASMPPSDWASLVKLLDAPLTQVALFLHRKHQGDSHGYDTGLALVVKALAEAAPAVVVDTKLVHEIFQRRVTRSTNELARIAATVHKLVGEVAAAEAAAPQLGNGGGAAGGHSSDDEFTESAGAAASSVLLEALDAKLRSYLNLYRKLHNSEDDGAILQSLAVQASVGIDVFQRVLLSAQNRSTAQRKRQGTKAGTVGVDEALRQQAAIIAAEVQGQVQGQSMATATVIRNGQVAGLGSNVTAAAVTVPVAQRGQSPAAVLGSVAPEPAEAVTEAVPGAYGSQPEGHQFPTAEDDQQQRRLCRVAFKSCPTAKEELLNRAFEAAASSEWAALTIKVLCHCPEGMSISELAKRAVELRYIVWPTTRPISDMHRQLRQAIGRVSIAPHVIHVGNSKYLLQAMRPDAKAVPRQAPAGRTGGGGSANSSPAAAVPPAAVMHTIGGGGAFSGMAGPPVPFSLLGALPVESAGTGSGGGLQQQNPTGAAQLSGAGPDSGAGADAAGGGGSTATGGGGEEELTLEEDSQQCRECLEAAVRAGADRQRVQEALSRLKSRNLRIVFKVLCHAGPTGLRVTDIVKFAREHRFVNWPDAADRTRSVHCAIRTSKDMIVHVGTHQYALTLFPGVVHVPK